MKKTMKPMALVLAVMLLLGTVLTGCGGGGGTDAVVGKWSLESIEMNGTSYNLADFANQFGVDASQTNISFDIKADGTVTGDAAGETAEGTWKAANGTYTLTIDGQDQTATMENGKLVMEMNGTKMVLAK